MPTYYNDEDMLGGGVADASTLTGGGGGGSYDARDALRDAYGGVRSLGRSILDPGRGARQRAMDMQQRGQQQWQRLYGQMPREDELYNPEYAEGFGALAGPQSRVNQLGGDASYQQGGEAQLRALRQMQGISEGGGYTTLERDQIRQAQNQAAQYEQSQRAAQVQQMQMRGMAGGGAELAGRLQAQQSGANQAANSATDVATAAQMRALQAMQGGAQIGSNVQNQAQSRASAVDAFNQANTNRQQTQANLSAANRQDVAQRNAAARGQATRDAYANHVNIAAGMSNQFNVRADSANQNATNTANRVNSLITGLANS
jgi:hypothetical protein